MRKEVIGGTGDVDTEVELSAQDLVALARCPLQEPDSVKSPGEAPRQAPRHAPPSPVAATTTSVERRIVISRIALPVGLMAAGIAGAAVLYAHLELGDTVSPAPQSTLRALPAGQSEWSEPEPEPKPEPEGKPVLFRNPFDASEVFEFPPGTSRDAAREAVSKMLIERAMERKPAVDARLKKKR